MQVKTNVKAGAAGEHEQHNEAQVRPRAAGLRVQTGVKAGLNFAAIKFEA